MAYTAEDARRRRADFPALAREHRGEPLAFLDGPAGTQVPQAVIDAIATYYRTCNANTHGQFPTSRESDALVDGVRAAAADFLGAEEPAGISFGQNMTTLAFALAHALGRGLKEGDEVVVTQLDHEANRGPWLMLRERGAVVREIHLRPDGVLDPDDFARQIGPRTRLVAIGHASNALGTVNDVRRAADLARAAGALTIVDAVHSAAHLPIDVRTLGCDFLLCSAYKFYGPHVGLLYARPGLLDRLETDRLSTQEPAAPWRIETGTLNHAALAGVGAAIDYIAGLGAGSTRRERILDAMRSLEAYERSLARRYDDGLREVPGARRWGPALDVPERAPTVSITIEGAVPEHVARTLGHQGIQVWDGDFYAARPVEVLGLAARGGLLRTGFSLYNTPEEVDRLLGALRAVAAGL